MLWSFERWGLQLLVDQIDWVLKRAVCSWCRVRKWDYCTEIIVVRLISKVFLILRSSSTHYLGKYRQKQKTEFLN